MAAKSCPSYTLGLWLLLMQLMKIVTNLIAHQVIKLTDSVTVLCNQVNAPALLVETHTGSCALARTAPKRWLTVIKDRLCALPKL
jgi:hypothetical protein